ncbi:hypothetical protein [Aquimarina macrocephali]|uniref:hypothetical protein n=1 Tax=Aquimarina macrocephali TaxID=666563 RepID=UPI003F67AC82
MNKTNKESVVMMKERALMLIPVFEVSRKDSINKDYIDIFDDLEGRVNTIISQL